MSVNNKILNFILITPAKNEEEHIEKTISSVLSQSYLPLKWIIVNDNSTDSTEEIIAKHTKKIRWIKALTGKDKQTRNFASKAFAFNHGYQFVKNLNFDVIGNLDADLSFDNDYFEYLIEKFSLNANLGVAGTPFVENGKKIYDYRFTNIEHVSGACQLFRKSCFESIGGYVPIKEGGIDWVSVTTARMMGWETRTFTEKVIIHHRKMGTGNKHTLIPQYYIGKKDYLFGNHPLWEVFRVLYQMKNRPYILGGMFIFLGYFFSFLRPHDKPISKELIKFNRQEQIQRLKQKIFAIFFR